MTGNSKARDEAETKFARKEKAAAEGARAMLDYLADGRAVRERTEALRKARLARDAKLKAEGLPLPGAKAPRVAKKPSVAKKPTNGAAGAAVSKPPVSKRPVSKRSVSKRPASKAPKPGAAKPINA